MKRLLFLTILLFTIFISSSELKAESATPTIKIKDKMFIGQCYDIYMNVSDYVNKNIEIEGYFIRHIESNIPYNWVVRHAPGCCGDDGEVGFEFQNATNLPKENSWIQVIGRVQTAKRSTQGGSYDYIYLDVVSLKVLEKEGKGFVTQ